MNLDLHEASFTQIPPAASSSSPFHIPAELDIHAQVGPYCLRTARTREDREAACRLRFRVFNLELGEGLDISYETGLDTDLFDSVCEHLVVQEKESGRIVGTYRMQSGPTAARNLGYYSAQEFELAPYEPLRDGILELGRAAIDRSHRTPEVLTLLWRGIAQYAHGMGLRYLLGCSSLNSVDPAEGWQMYRQLHYFRVSPEFETIPTAAYACPIEPQAASTQSFACNGTPESTAQQHAAPVAAQVKVPKLLKSYLAIGARIAAPPAFDREFRTIDFLTLLDLEMLSPAARNRFLAPLTS
ncbi:MAG TPA: GNAT family N-acyltransferase [Terracidiphilus sp.]|nr:GNAT family N-acyltransferase [Terracidiphilus sp.]